MQTSSLILIKLLLIAFFREKESIESSLGSRNLNLILYLQGFPFTVVSESDQ